MPSCMPPRFRLQDVVFAVFGTFAFLGDLGSDLWSAVRYYNDGGAVYAGLHFGLYVLSSVVLQILSCGWFWVDWKQWEADVCAAASEPGTGLSNGMKGSCSVDAVLIVDKKPLQEDNTASHAEAHSLLHPNGDNSTQQCASVVTSTAPPQEPATSSSAHHDEYIPFYRLFYTSRFWKNFSFLLIPHILQLGYPLRCLHSLEVGIAAFRSSESSPKFNLYQEYAYFLTHDISMMRLIETFLENTPQLILVLYVIIQRETIERFQWFSIGFSFICISWAILDYHQSLRLFLKDKKKLNFYSSVFYYLWNFCLISSRIMCITLFAITFHWMIFVHFASLWLFFFIWVCFQKTDFMQITCLEPLYRATVAVILYFSWFNIADGRTIHRCILYHILITIDSLILLLSWEYQSFPSILDEYEDFIIGTTASLTILGLLLRSVYYMYVHPNVRREPKESYDEPDGIVGGSYKMFAPTEEITSLKSWKQNERMVHLTQQIY